MAQVISRRLLTAEVLVRSRFIPCETYGGQNDAMLFLRVHRIFRVSIILPMLHTYFKYKLMMYGNLPKSIGALGTKLLSFTALQVRHSRCVV